MLHGICSADHLHWLEGDGEFVSVWKNVLKTGTCVAVCLASPAWWEACLDKYVGDVRMSRNRLLNIHLVTRSRSNSLFIIWFSKTFENICTFLVLESVFLKFSISLSQFQKTWPSGEKIESGGCRGRLTHSLCDTARSCCIARKSSWFKQQLRTLALYLARSRKKKLVYRLSKEIRLLCFFLESKFKKHQKKERNVVIQSRN